MAKIGNIPQQVNDPFTKLDQGSFLFTCEGVKEGDYEGRMIYDASFRVQQPASHQGQVHYERWWIGSDEDPEALLPDTWTSNGGKMKKCCEALGVPFLGQNPDMVTQQMIGKQVCGKVTHRQYTNNEGKPATAANVSQWGQPGTMTPEVIGSDNGQPPAQAPMTPAPIPAQAPGVGTPTPPVAPQAPQQGGPVAAPPGPPLPPQYQQRGGRKLELSG